jgi:hypothetical protein
MLNIASFAGDVEYTDLFKGTCDGPVRAWLRPGDWRR